MEKKKLRQRMIKKGKIRNKQKRKVVEEEIESES